MIVFEDVSVRYQGQHTAVLREVSLRVPEGELCLVVGQTGSGKSTLLRAVNGLVPHFTGGTLAGRVLVAGRDTRTHRPRDLADVVGVVGQDPQSGFVADVVEDELAFGMEWLGLAPDVMRAPRRGDARPARPGRRAPPGDVDTVRRPTAAGRDRGGTHRPPRVLVLDEPTSAPGSAGRRGRAGGTRSGSSTTWARPSCWPSTAWSGSCSTRTGSCTCPATGGSSTAARPDHARPLRSLRPVVELGRLAGWQPLPLSVRDARRAAPGLRAPRWPTADRSGRAAATRDGATLRWRRTTGLVVRYGDTVALRDVDFAVRPGEIVALMGRNGAGKSRLLTALVGLVEPAGGSVVDRRVCSRTAPNRASRARRRPGAAGARRPALRRHRWPPSAAAPTSTPAADRRERCRALLTRLAPEVARRRPIPRDLSEGQRLASPSPSC